MLAWNHNAYYERLLLRAVPAGAARVLDVGCGTGALAARLARRVDRVDAVDRDAVMVHAAQASTPANVTVWLADVMHDRLPAQNYDAIVSMSALHHLPLQPALRRLGSALRPGGVLAAVALPRTELPRELPIEAAAAIWHLAVGAVLRATDGQWPHGLAHGHHPEMPIRDPELTIRQVRRAAEQVLPRVRVRRLLLWRYLLTWQAPTTPWSR